MRSKGTSSTTLDNGTRDRCVGAFDCGLETRLNTTSNEEILDSNSSGIINTQTRPENAKSVVELLNQLRV